MYSAPQASYHLDSKEPISTHGCPLTTVKPDANGWVPAGTCGYLSRPYYPSFVAAIVFSAAAAAVLASYAIRIVRATFHDDMQSSKAKSLWCKFDLRWIGIFLSTCLLAAYISRAFGTKHQQKPAFVAFSDTIVLLCPVLVFTLDCIVLTRMMKAIYLENVAAASNIPLFSWGFPVLISALISEHLISSVLIVPKRRPSASRGASETAMLGLKLYLAGITFQALLLAYTIVQAAAIRSHLAREKSLLGIARVNDVFRQAKMWRSIPIALLFSLSSISLRTTYRTVELSGLLQGRLLFLAQNEVFFYVFECLPILAAIGVWAVVDIGTLSTYQDHNIAPICTYRYHEVGEELLPTRRNVSQFDTGTE